MNDLDRQGIPMEKRMTDIEMQLMHHENTIQQLHEVVAGQQLVIEKLQNDIKLLVEQLRMLSPSAVRHPLDEEPPPHY